VGKGLWKSRRRKSAKNKDRKGKGNLDSEEQRTRCNMARRGVWGNREKGKKKETSSSQGPIILTRAARAVWMVGSRFKYLCFLCSDEEKQITTKIEEAIHLHQHNIAIRLHQHNIFRQSHCPRRQGMGGRPTIFKD
jgi:hypothetical protein